MIIPPPLGFVFSLLIGFDVQSNRVHCFVLGRPLTWATGEA
jgi:hypothetical protein